ncbi:urea carboxylase [Salinihabitans flavidus]|uniref:Urea carboxylase n=1 Tax=Salinihabitans flavidus TaxID=569882 RepID=A0A1H8MMV4_9RHOB|nr:biotin-dependent carboxyltransferase family protein [Salinihabitans flavidus]SEO18657.1 urea carboxylase [Salinihabitans flavidus]
MALKIVKPGLATSIQDLGRPGYFHLGIPQGGAMDRLAMRAANMLVGNPEEAAGLEAVFMGPEIAFTADASVAVTGAEMPVTVDGEPRETWTSFTVRKGQVLGFGFLQKGARIYIAVSGGIDTPPDLGSRSTYPIGALGGIEGRPIEAGDTLPVGSAPLVEEGRSAPAQLRRMPGNPAELRALPGLYWHRITEAAQQGFFDDTWTVAAEADRMGYRFKGGRVLEFVEREQPFGAGADPSNIVDGCYSYGSIQVPGGTEPIVLHRDAVSGGGYFTLGAVISADMDLIGQLQPNTEVKFRRVDMAEALAARAERRQMIEKLRQELA